MNTADRKSVKWHEFSTDEFVAEGEHILFAIIIGPDRDNPKEKRLHLRARADGVEVLRTLPYETRLMIMEHQDRLLKDFRRRVLGEVA
jgi:hypothetical protein